MFLFCKEFSAKFTQRYLMKYLDDAIELPVQCAGYRKSYNVKMRLGLDLKRAMLTSGWAKAVRRFGLEEGCVYIFCFSVDKKGHYPWLLIDPLEA
jgi:hypothetical protein